MPGQEKPSPNTVDDDRVTRDFVTKNIGWMLTVAMRILDDRMYAEDAVQNAFQKIFAGLDGFEGRSSLKTWMHRIVVNEALMILRRRTTRMEGSIDPLLPRFDESGCRVDQALVVSKTPESLLNDAQIAQNVQQAIQQLPDSFRLVLTLRDIEGYSTAEVGDVLGISEANVKTRLHRARSALKKLLEPLFGADNV